MSSLSELKNAISLKLSTQMKGIDFCTDYNDAAFLYALKRPLVCIYLKGINANSGVMGDFLLNKSSEQGAASTYGKAVSIEMGIQIFCSSSKESVGCDDIFTALSEFMMLDTELDLQSISCTAAQYQNKHEVFTLNAAMHINMMLAKELQSPYVTDFTLDVTL